MNPIGLVQLPALMEVTRGAPEIKVGLIDGPVALDHPQFSRARVDELPSAGAGDCARPSSIACLHGTFVAGILSANRNGIAPAICPDCTLVVRPIFGQAARADAQVPSTTPEELAAAVVECVAAGARLLNLSLALTSSSLQGDRALRQALDHAARNGVIVVAAAGNQGIVGSSAITRHPWVIPVAACDARGRPLSYSNLGNSIGRRGLSAPGENIRSLGSDGKILTLSGTSVAAPFVTGAIALIWSAFPAAGAAQIKLAIGLAHTSRRRSVAPPVLNAWQSYLATAQVAKQHARGDVTSALRTSLVANPSLAP